MTTYTRLGILFHAAIAVTSASTIRFNDRNITVIPGDGPVLSSYKMRFGSFTAGFTPTIANFSQWNANFNGSTGAHTPGVSTSIDFTADDNSVHTLNSTMYMLVYNISPSAAIETATKGVLLTRDGWVAHTFGYFDQPQYDSDENFIGYLEVQYNYLYNFNAGWDPNYATTPSSFRNFDEDNFLPLTDTSSFSSPVNDIFIYNGGIGISQSFSAVPEPSTLAYSALALLAAVAVRRSRHHSKKN